MADAAPTHWIIALGSNVDDAAGQLAAARADLLALGSLRHCADPVRSADIEGLGPDYLNQLVELRTALPAARLSVALKEMEQRHGRSAQRLAGGCCDLDLDLHGCITDGRIERIADKPLPVAALREQLLQWPGAS